MDINLNIFTNSIQAAPDINIVRQTYQSFCDTFGEIPTTIYCDSHPNTAKFPEYLEKKNLGVIMHYDNIGFSETTV